MSSILSKILFLILLSVSAFRICSKSCDTSFAPHGSVHSPIVSSGGGTRRPLFLDNTKEGSVAPKKLVQEAEAPNMYPTTPSSTKAPRVFSFTPPSLPGGIGFNNNPPGQLVMINVNQTAGGGSTGPPPWIYVVLAIVSLAVSVFGLFKYCHSRDSGDCHGISDLGLH